VFLPRGERGREKAGQKNGKNNEKTKSFALTFFLHYVTMRKGDDPIRLIG